MHRSNPILAALLCAAFAAAPFPAEAGPRFAQGDVFFAGTVEVSETSRASPRADSSSDTIFAFIPSVSYNRESARMDLNASLSAPFRRYDSNSRLDSDSLQFNLNGEVPFGANPRLSGTWSLNYFDGVQSSYLTNRNLDSTTFGANIYGDYRFGNRLSARARAQYSDRSSSGIDSAFTNANTSTLYAIGLHARQLIGGRVGLYAEYVVQERETDRGLINQGVDATDDGVNFGITGQLLPERLFPKLEADLSFGFTSSAARDRFTTNPNAGRSNRLTLNGSLRYPANPRTNVALTYNRNLAITDDDRTVERGQLQLSVDYTPRQRLTFITSVGMQTNDFIYATTERSDDVLTASVAANYSIRQNWSARLSYNYRDSSSNVFLSDYSSSLITLSTTLRY